MGFLREGGDQDHPSLKPPLEVLETFGGAKVSDDDQLKTELEIYIKDISHAVSWLRRHAPPR